jgi:magnesium-transporting ATPase (P-type)
MRTVITDLINGDATKKLSILSDIATITSVVLVSLLAPAFSLASNTELSFSAIATISAIVLLTVAGSTAALAAFLSIDTWLSTRSNHRLLLRVSLWCIALVVAICAAAFVYELLTNTYWT